MLITNEKLIYVLTGTEYFYSVDNDDNYSYNSIPKIKTPNGQLTILPVAVCVKYAEDGKKTSYKKCNVNAIYKAITEAGNGTVVSFPEYDPESDDEVVLTKTDDKWKIEVHTYQGYYHDSYIVESEISDVFINNTTRLGFYHSPKRRIKK